jgi:hypothetical protein
MRIRSPLSVDTTWPILGNCFAVLFSLNMFLSNYALHQLFGMFFVFLWCRICISWSSYIRVFSV